MQRVTIAPVGRDRTIVYAAEELARYLRKISPGDVDIRLEEAYRPEDEPAIRVGLAGSFPDLALPRVRDPLADDAVRIRISGGRGIVAGNNTRSVLLAVYRYLTILGCRWVRPGPDGEYTPRVDWLNMPVDLTEAPSYRHRGICIEGAVGWEHLRAIIEWAPRVGFNAYFIQFREGYTFFERWYGDTGNPGRKKTDFPVERARELVRMAADEIGKRGLLHHAVGHGWTCEPFGLPGLGWDYPPVEAPPEAARHLALVNGARRVWHGIPLNTNLCYSNPKTRRIVSEAIASYAAVHPEVDYLHIWLADGANNHCECEDCRRLRPADFYVMLLNEADALLTQRGLPARLVFLIYVDLLWPPEVERFRNPARFTLMFAPITRTYSTPFSCGGELPVLQPYERNKLNFPGSVAENVSFLRAWQKVFPGDGFDFDYHYMWDHLFDPGYTAIAAVLQRDIQLLGEIGLDGYVSCQTQRAFLPTGLGMTAMGRTLWRRDLGFEEIARDYYAAAFGPEGQACRAYLEKLTELFDPIYLRGEKPDSPAVAAALEKVPGAVAEFRPVVERNLGLAEPCWAASWRYLIFHGDLCAGLAKALAARARGEDAEARGLWEEVKRMVWAREDEAVNVFDAWLFTRTYEGKFRKQTEG
ncbi:MAG: DUF4838 domain-containing protein [Patescibacteria group bacterium]